MKNLFFGFLKFVKDKKILLMTVGILSQSSIFADTQSDFQSAQSYIQSTNLSSQLDSSINQNSVPISIPQNPEQAQYYNNPNAIQTDSLNKVAASGSTGNTINNDTLNDPKYSVNPNSPEIQSGKLIQANSAAIVNGTYKDCNKQNFTKITYTNETCETSLPIKFPCTRTLNVAITKTYPYVDQNEDLSNRVSPSGSSAVVHLDAQSGILKSFSMHVRDASNPWSCFQTYYLDINGNRIAYYNPSCGGGLGDLQFNAYNLQIHFQNNSFQITLEGANLSGHFTGSVTLSVKQEKDTATDTWASSCPSMPSICQIQSTCLQPNQTKIISDVPVERACWQYRDNYQCGSQMSSSCSALENQGCTQIGSQCTQTISGMCNLFSETWSCPSKQVIGQGIACGKQFYCLDGSCQQTTTAKNQDFGKSVTDLAAAASAGADVQNQNVSPSFNPNSIEMFTGQKAECRKLPVGIENCCSDTGWGRGIFVNCNDEEKHLGQAKEKGLVVATGEYCHKHLGICFKPVKTYCIFPSKLALDIQVFGRQDQLHRGFGNGKNTDCSGITPSEMQQIDFSKIDFTNVIGDITNQATLPNFQQKEEAIAQKIIAESEQDEQGGGQ